MTSSSTARHSAAFVVQAMDIIGERWTVPILLQISLGARHFNEIKGNLNISSGILARRLRALMVRNLLEQQESERPPYRREYVLTEAGRALQPPLIEILRWASEHPLKAARRESSKF